VLTVSVKYSKHGACVEYDILNFSMHSSTSTQNVLKVSSLKITRLLIYILSICAVVHTKIEYIILNTGAVR